jgi:hypothetical protein
MDGRKGQMLPSRWRLSSSGTAHVDPSLWKNGRVDPKLLDPVCRLSGSGYASLGDLVNDQRPQWKISRAPQAWTRCRGRNDGSAAPGSLLWRHTSARDNNASRAGTACSNPSPSTGESANSRSPSGGRWLVCGRQYTGSSSVPGITSASRMDHGRVDGGRGGHRDHGFGQSA